MAGFDLHVFELTDLIEHVEVCILCEFASVPCFLCLMSKSCVGFFIQ